MAGSITDPSQWRLRTRVNSIPYKFLGADGSFTMEGGDVTYRVIIPSNQLINFIGEIFPAATVFGNVAVPQGAAQLQGLPNLRAKKVSFKSQDSGKPIDPFGFDSSSPAGTYYEACELEINYGPSQVQDSKPNDPSTFLDISASASGEFIHTPLPKAKWVARVNPDVPAGELNEPPGVIPANNQVGNNPRVDPAEVNKDAQVPASILVPLTDWTVKWNQIPYEYFRDVMVWRLRFMLGRVNNDFYPILFNAYPGTLLFTGYTYSNQYTWRDGLANAPPVNVEMKILEKCVIYKGVVQGHNDFWRPGVGWQRLLQDGVNPVFPDWDYNTLFNI